MVFIGLSKTFDTLDRSTLWTLLRRCGCPETFVKIIQEYHNGMAGAVSIGGSTTDPFEISHGLKQGCVLAPTLFTLFLAALLSTVSEHHSTGVFIRTRSDGKLFKLARLKASTKSRELCIRELLFVDDAAIVAHTLEHIREICKQFEQAATMFGLTINTKKTVTLYQHHPAKPQSIHMLKSMASTTNPADIMENHIPNVEVLRRTNMSSIEATLTASQLLWTGHIISMNDSRLPTAVFYGELAKGKRLRGGQRLRYKDVVKRHLKATHITVDH